MAALKTLNNHPLSNQAQITSSMQHYMLRVIKDTLLDKKSDILCLEALWPEAVNLFKTYLLNWPMYEFDTKQALRPIIKILQYKLYKFRFKVLGPQSQYLYLYEQLYPNVTFFVEQFNQLFKEEALFRVKDDPAKLEERLEKIKEEYQLKENIMDKLLKDYFSEYESISDGKGSFSVIVQGMQKKPLKDFIGEIMALQRRGRSWEKAFQLLTVNCKRQRETKQTSINHKYPNTSCLGCASFFLVNTPITHFQANITLKTFEDSLVEKNKESILKEICLMLSNHGGIILFSCVREYASICPKGAYINEQFQAKNKRLIENYIQEIRPHIGNRAEILVTFVPMFASIRTKRNKQDRNSNQLQYKQTGTKNFFLMRIKVCPKVKGIHYQIGESITQIVQQPKTDPRPFLPATFGNPLNHTCESPLTDLSQQNLQLVFKYMSMIVIKQTDIDKLQRLLQEQGIICCIQAKFHHYSFSIAKYTAVLYHDQKFEKIIQLFANPNNTKFIFDQKKVLAVFITEYLKIEQFQKVNSKDIQNVSEWLKKEFPQENMTLWYLKKEKQEKKEIYVKVESKLSTLFMYYIFNNFKVKTLFKNPPPNDVKNLKILSPNDIGNAGIK